MQCLKKVNDIIEIITGMFFLVMTVVVLLQVFFRYVLNKPVAEFLEISIYAMVYLVMFLSPPRAKSAGSSPFTTSKGE